MDFDLKAITKKVSRTYLSRMIFFVLCDIVFVALSVYLAFLLRFDYEIPKEHLPAIRQVIVLSLIFYLPIFYFSKLYSFSWSYVSAGELISLVKASTLAFLFLAIAIYLSKDFPGFWGFPRATLFVSYFLIMFLSGGLRFAKRVFLRAFIPAERKNKERTLIVGAGDAGEQILRNILSSKNSPFSPICFVDDSQAKQGLIIHGLKVSGSIKEIPLLAKNHQAEGMIIALSSAGADAIKRAVEAGRQAGLKKIKIVPTINEIINGEVSIRDLREIQVEDLLGRQPISLNTKSIENYIFGKTVLITGAAGSIGSELSRQVSKFKPSQLLLLDRDETGIFNISEELEDKFPNLKIHSLIADILDKEKISQIFNKFKPNIIFHAAAYKHVPLMERNPEAAIKNNIFGTETVAKEALHSGAEKFIFISTDKAVNPVSIMGATKRVGEMMCQYLNQKNHTKFISVRFGNVLDSRGSVIPIFREQIKKGGPIEVTHPEMKRYFMVTSEACLLVMQAGALGKGGEVFVLDMGKPLNILDLAKEMIRLSGLEPDKNIPIVFTNPRPGEKYFEEILTAEEGTEATQNQKIFTARLSQVKEDILQNGLLKLKTAAGSLNREEIVFALKQIIPTYKQAAIQDKVGDFIQKEQPLRTIEG